MQQRAYLETRKDAGVVWIKFPDHTQSALAYSLRALFDIINFHAAAGDISEQEKMDFRIRANMIDWLPELIDSDIYSTVFQSLETPDMQN